MLFGISVNMPNIITINNGASNLNYVLIVGISYVMIICHFSICYSICNSNHTWWITSIIKIIEPAWV